MRKYLIKKRDKYFDMTAFEMDEYHWSIIGTPFLDEVSVKKMILKIKEEFRELISRTWPYISNEEKEIMLKSNDLIKIEIMDDDY